MSPSHTVHDTCDGTAPREDGGEQPPGYGRGVANEVARLTQAGSNENAIHASRPKKSRGEVGICIRLAIGSPPTSHRTFQWTSSTSAPAFGRLVPRGLDIGT